MSVAAKRSAGGGVFNVPNQLTALRFLLSIVLFVLIALEYYAPAAAVFVVAASTDWLDGYLARKYGQITVLGRILDPFVDKIIICGSFIFLVAVPVSQVQAWMAVVVVGRELLVTALRSFLEGEGADFSARASGKLKMVLQCAAVTVCLVALSLATIPPWLAQLVGVTLYSSVAITLYSGLEYVFRAISLMRK